MAIGCWPPTTGRWPPTTGRWPLAALRSSLEHYNKRRRIARCGSVTFATTLNNLIYGIKLDNCPNYMYYIQIYTLRPCPDCVHAMSTLCPRYVHTMSTRGTARLVRGAWRTPTDRLTISYVICSILIHCNVYDICIILLKLVMIRSI